MINLWLLVVVVPIERAAKREYLHSTQLDDEIEIEALGVRRAVPANPPLDDRFFW